MKINWKVRFRHRQFWMAFIAALLLVADQIAVLFGYDFAPISEQVRGIAETVLMVFVVFGVIIDPTTNGLKDSERALTYKKPK